MAKASSGGPRTEMIGVRIQCPHTVLLKCKEKRERCPSAAAVLKRNSRTGAKGAHHQCSQGREVQNPYISLRMPAAVTSRDRSTLQMPSQSTSLCQPVTKPGGVFTNDHERRLDRPEDAGANVGATPDGTADCLTSRKAAREQPETAGLRQRRVRILAKTTQEEHREVRRPMA